MASNRGEARPLRAVWRVMARQGGMGRAIALAALVLLAGAGLLALSGWFITAAAMAGLAGAGAVFDVFRPGAAVRALAMLRSISRYGERWLGHDATLRAVVGLRRSVLAGLSRLDWRAQGRLRRGPALARVIGDCDLLDGLALRLVIPAVAGVVALAAAFAFLGLMLGWLHALWICGSHLLAALAALCWGLPRAARLAPAQVAAEQRFRIAVLDLIAARDDLAVYGRLPQSRAEALEADREARHLRADLDRIERGVTLAQELARLASAGGALALGAAGVEAGAFGPAMAASGFFVALALGEVTSPLRRAVADYGRIRDAATRVAPMLGEDAPPAATDAKRPALPLQIGDLSLGAGQMLALSGPSGVGKTTLLSRIAGVLPDPEGEIRLGGLPPTDWPEDNLRAALTLVLQRPALIAGSLRDNLRLAAPDASDAEMVEALRIACLDGLRGGLDLELGDGGAGLSGGERRRLAIARAILRRPMVLLLDEPTEGLDRETAGKMLKNLREFMAEGAIVIATHQLSDILRADLTLELR